MAINGTLITKAYPWGPRLLWHHFIGKTFLVTISKVLHPCTAAFFHSSRPLAGDHSVSTPVCKVLWVWDGYTVSFFFTGAWQPSLLLCYLREWVNGDNGCGLCRSQARAYAVCTDWPCCPSSWPPWLIGGSPDGRHAEEVGEQRTGRRGEFSPRGSPTVLPGGHLVTHPFTSI